MKLTRLIAAALLGTALTACNSDDKDDNDFQLTYNYTFDNILDTEAWTAQGYADFTYDSEVGNLTVYPALTFTHKAGESYGMKYWNGFTISRSTDKADHTGENWLDYQWGSITGTGAQKSRDYMLAYWSTDETLAAIPENPSCGMSFAADAYSRPLRVDITNSAYGYYAMLNGTDYSKAFGEDDWCKVVIKGVRSKAITSTVEVYLARNGKILNEWTTVDLTPLGVVDYIYFQMESSDTGSWGMNNPSFFCLDNMQVYYTDQAL